MADDGGKCLDVHAVLERCGGESVPQIAKAETTQDMDTTPRKPAPSTFQPHKGQRRRPGAGCISQINENLWEGRYSPRLPNGTRLARNVYAHSEEECEQKLSDLIVQMKAEIAAQRQQFQTPA